MEKDTIISNFEVELKRGTQTLQVLYLLKNEQYGYSLLQALEHRDVQIEAGTLYPLLRRLESQGLLMSNWDTTESRPRKYYVLSLFGEEVLSHLLETWEKSVAQMKVLIKGEQQ
ncbi:MAG: PadR family transcriptional regulator [Acholeplasma sp.]|nr:PadR family transcriptional regulator [Acholeplasma sp.]